MINIKLDKKAKNVISKTADFGSDGPIVVTELPKVGEEHTIYELQEKKVVAPIVVMIDQQMIDDRVMYADMDCFFAFTTTEEMQNTLTAITPNEDHWDEIYLNYITEEDKLIGAEYTHDAWKFTEALKVSDCKFDVSEIFVLEDNKYVVILKEYFPATIEEWETFATGTLWNGKTYTFNEKRVSGVLLGTPTVGDMTQTECGENLEELPPDTPSDEVFETIPYEKIINYQLTDNHWYFTPKSEEITVTSYWIYTNKEWVNVDEIGEPKYFSVYVTSSHMSGLSNIPLDEVSFYMGEKELQLIKLTNNEEQDFGCLLVPITNNYDNIYSVTMKLTDEALSLLGGDSNLYINPTFVSYEDPINVRLDSSVSEYDFELLLGTLTLFNGNML